MIRFLRYVSFCAALVLSTLFASHPATAQEVEQTKPAPERDGATIQAEYICANQPVPLDRVIRQAWKTNSGQPCYPYGMLEIVPVTGAMWICAIGSGFQNHIPYEYVVTQISTGALPQCAGYVGVYITPAVGNEMYICNLKAPPAGWYVYYDYGSNHICGYRYNQHRIRR